MRPFHHIRSTKTSVNILLFLGLLLAAQAQNPNNFVTVKTISSSSGGDDRVYDAAIGSMNTIIIGGRFSDNMDVDPGDGVTTLVGQGASVPTGYVAKYSESGTLKWAFELPSSDLLKCTMVFGVNVDASDNVLVTGEFAGTVDFDPSGSTYNMTSASSDPNGIGSVFFAKYTSSGTFLWAKKIDVLGNRVLAVKKDGSDNIYLCGSVSGDANTVDFDPGAGTAYLAGTMGCWIAKYNSSGTFQWVKMPIPNSWAGLSGWANNFHVDATGNCYVTGTFSSTNDFDPGTGTTSLNPASGGAFIAKYNSSGALQFVKQFGGSGTYPYAVKVNASSEVFIAGTFTGTNLDFDPGTATQYRSSQYYSYQEWQDPNMPDPPPPNTFTGYNTEGFLLKLSSTGTYSWVSVMNMSASTYTDANSMTTPTYLTPMTLTLDASGYATVSGIFFGTSDFTSAAIATNYSSYASNGAYAGFVAKFNSTGSLQTVRTLTGSSGGYINNDYMFNLSSNSGSVFIVGCYTGTVDFDPANTQEMVHKNQSWPTSFNKYSSNNQAMGGAFAIKSSLLGSRDIFISLYSTASALPVTLLNFNAVNDKNTTVSCMWETSAELNNDKFIVERSADGYNFELVTEVKGAGSSNEKLDYRVVDNSPFKGVSYYRLTQVDFDGRATTYDMVPVSVKDGVASVDFELFPNPAEKGQIPYIKLFGDEQKEVLLVVTSLTGQESYTKAIVLEVNGDNVVAIDPENKLVPGVYMISATSDNAIYHKKLVIK